MKVRYAKKNEKNVAIEHWKNSFKDDENQINFYFENIFEHKNFLVLEKDKRIVSSLHENPYILNFNSNEIKTKYIVGVSTPANEQRKGYMTFLMKEMLKKSLKDNYPFVFLTPINPDIYRRYGFEYFSRIINYTFDIENLSEIKIKNNVEIKEIKFDSKDDYLEDLIKIYNENMESKFCYLKRDKKYFNKLLLECFNEDMKVFISYQDRIPKSYIIFSKSDNEIWVRESFAINYEEQANIIALLYAYKDYYTTINFSSCENSNIEFLFKNQLKIKKIETPFMMLRVIKPLKVLEFCDIKLENLKIYIEDEILEENTGVYTYNKKWSFSKVIEDYTFKINIRDLVLLVCGFFDFNEIKNMGKIELKNDKNIGNEKLLKMFNKKNSYLYEFQ